MTNYEIRCAEQQAELDSLSVKAQELHEELVDALADGDLTRSDLRNVIARAIDTLEGFFYAEEGE